MTQDAAPISLLSLLVWDSPAYTRNLLINLRELTPGIGHHLRILDQGSGPETQAILQEFAAGKPHISIDRLERNIGYGPGHNRNLRMTRGRVPYQYFVTINNDLVFGDAGWLTELVTRMEAEPQAALGGPFCYRGREGKIGLASRAECMAGDFMFVTGAVAILRVAAIERAGLFDEIYAPAYWEDADLAMRYKAMGYTELFIDLPVVHGYLGDADRVNMAKREQLVRDHGEFRIRNMRIFVERWIEGPGFDLKRRDVRTVFPQLYIPD